jgi:putative nucleotide binding protein
MEQQEQHKAREEYAIVLDFLPNGYPFDTRPGYMKTPIVQAIGKIHFVLLELVPKKEITLQPHEDVYIGEGKRDKIHHINGRLPPSKLTATAKAELEFVIANIVKANEQRFLNFVMRLFVVYTQL